MVVVWSTLHVNKEGIVTILAKAHTDVDIHMMKVAFFDETRYLSLSVFGVFNQLAVGAAIFTATYIVPSLVLVGKKYVPSLLLFI